MCYTDCFLLFYSVPCVEKKGAKCTGCGRHSKAGNGDTLSSLAGWVRACVAIEHRLGTRQAFVSMQDFSPISKAFPFFLSYFP
jgi:hypothetical protein